MPFGPRHPDRENQKRPPPKPRPVKPIPPRPIGPAAPRSVWGGPKKQRKPDQYPLIKQKAEEQRDDWMHETLP